MQALDQPCDWGLQTLVVRSWIEDGCTLDMNRGHPQFWNRDRVWTSTVHAYYDRTVDTLIAVIEANHPNLINQKLVYVEISHPRDRTKLMPDDNEGLREQLDTLTKQRTTALEVLGVNGARDSGTVARREMRTCMGRSRPGVEPAKERTKTPVPKTVDRDLGL